MDITREKTYTEKKKAEKKWFEEKELANKMLGMALHEEIKIRGHIWCMKVFGGWIYYSDVWKWSSFVPDERHKT